MLKNSLSKNLVFLVGKVYLLVMLMMISSCQKDEERVESRRIYYVPANLETKDFQRPLDMELTQKINTFSEKKWLLQNIFQTIEKFLLECIFIFILIVRTFYQRGIARLAHSISRK